MGQPERLVWKQPRPSPVEWVTPTLLRSVLSCPARVAFERDPRTSGLRRTGLRAALGTVAHKTWEKRAHGLPFDALWDRYVQEAWDDLVAEWAPAVPPSPPNWPGWALTKTRLRKAFNNRGDEATPILYAFAHESVRPLLDASSSPPPLPWKERWIEDRVRRIAGRPDRIERVNGALTVVDLKTGVRQGAANEDQRRQLLLYAALVQHELGELPVTEEIRDASGSAYSMVVAESEVEKVLDEAQEPGWP